MKIKLLKKHKTLIPDPSENEGQSLYHQLPSLLCFTTRERLYIGKGRPERLPTRNGKGRGAQSIER